MEYREEFEIGEIVYSRELVSAFIKDAYHCSGSQFTASDAEQYKRFKRAFAIIQTRDSKLAGEIVSRGQLDEHVRTYGTPVKIEMSNDNNGNLWVIHFGFWVK